MLALLRAAPPRLRTTNSITRRHGASLLVQRQSPFSSAASHPTSSTTTMAASPPSSPSDVLVVYVTCPDTASSDKVVDAVIPARLAACVNVVPGITSIYRWKGKVERDAEALLIMKTTRARLTELTAAVQAAHPYDTPEVLALPAVGGSEAYLKWVAEETA